MFVFGEQQVCVYIYIIYNKEENAKDVPKPMKRYFVAPCDKKQKLLI